MKFAPWREECANVFDKYEQHEHARIVRSHDTSKTELANIFLQESTMLCYLNACIEQKITSVEALTKGIQYLISTKHWWNLFFNLINNASTFTTAFERLNPDLQRNLCTEWIRDSATYAVPLMYAQLVHNHENAEQQIRKLNNWTPQRVYAYIQSAHCWSNQTPPHMMQIENVIDMLNEYSFSTMNAQEQLNVLHVIERLAHKINIHSLQLLHRNINAPTLTPWLIAHGACWAYSMYQMPALKTLMYETEQTWPSCTLARELLQYNVASNKSTTHPWLSTMVEMGLFEKVKEFLHPKTTVLTHNGLDLVATVETLDLEL